MTFEEAMQELETITKKLEDGRLPLDESLRLFERGHELKTHCDKLLSEAQLKVEQIISNTEKATFDEAPHS